MNPSDKKKMAQLLIDENPDHPEVQDLIAEFRRRPRMKNVSDGEAIAAMTRELMNS